MAAETYVGVGGVARKVKAQYVGVAGIARKVKKVYVGVNGTARLVWESGGTVPVPESFTCTLAASFSTRFGQSYQSSYVLNCSSDGNGGYSGQGYIELQEYTTVCDGVSITGVPASIRQSFGSVTVNGESLSLSGNTYDGGTQAFNIYESRQEFTIKFMTGSSGPV